MAWQPTDRWLLVVNEPSGVTFQLAGDCGDAKLRSLRPVDGVSIEGLTVEMLITSGPERIERLSFEVAPTTGDAVAIELDLQILEVEPCTIATTGGIWKGSNLTLEATIGAPATVLQVGTFGHCADDPWDTSSFPESVTFKDGDIVVNGEGPARSVDFNLGLISMSGFRIDYPVRVNFTE